MAITPTEMLNSFSTRSTCVGKSLSPISGCFCGFLHMQDVPSWDVSTMNTRFKGLNCRCCCLDSPSVDSVDDHGSTLLFYAIRHDNYRVVKALLEHGSDVNHENQHHQNALFLAIFPVCKVNIVTSLIAEGATISTKHFNFLSSITSRFQKSDTTILLLNFAVLAGYNIFNDFSISLEGVREPIKTWVEARIHTCLHLKQLCRIQIRKQLAKQKTGTCLSAVILQLCLPPQLIDYLTFTRRKRQILSQVEDPVS